MERRHHDPSWETLDRETLRARQFALLKDRLVHLQATNPFFAKRWADAGVDVTRIQSHDDFARAVPMIDKLDLLADQEAAPPFGDRLGVERDTLAQVHLTSGTTGIGQEAYGLTQHDVFVAGDTFAHAWTYAGLRPGDGVVITNPISFLAAGLAVAESARQIPLFPVFGFSLDKKMILNVMRRFEMASIYAVPTVLLQLQHLAEAEGCTREDFNLRAILTSVISPPFALIDEICEFWGVPVHDVYGCSQGSSAVAVSCEHGCSDGERRYPTHFLENYFLCEVVDPETGLPVGDGEEGELVLTTLQRDASPVVRFRMRDRVVHQPHHACPCGRPYDGMIPGETGRYDDMLKIKGANVWPPAVDNVLFAHKEVDEYRSRVVLTEDGHEELMMQVSFKPACGLDGSQRAALVAQLAAEVKAVTLVTPRVTEVAELAHFDFKPQRWADEREKGLQKVVW